MYDTQLIKYNCCNRYFYRQLLFLIIILSSISCAQLESIRQEEGVVNIRSYRVAGDGETDDSGLFRQAIDDMAGKSSRLIIPRGNFLIDNVTFPDNVTLVFRDGKLRIPEGGQIRINGSIEAGMGQIISGAGSVTGSLDNIYVYPQWFGARGNGMHNDAPALQQAADLAASSMGNTLFIPHGEYLFLNDIEFRSNIESRGLLVKQIEIDEERTQFSNFTFVPTHHSKKDPNITFASDYEEKELQAEYFYGVEEGQFKVPNYRNIPLANEEGTIDLDEGGTLRFYSSDFFSSRRDRKGDSFYDRNDISQIVSGRGDVFPEFAFTYIAPADAGAWSEHAEYKKGDYVTYGGELFKATWSSGEGSVFEDRYLGTIDIGSITPEPGKSTTLHNFVFDNGSEDNIRIWRRVDTWVWYRKKDRHLSVNGLRVEVRLKDHKGESKRINSGVVYVNRSNMVFNNLEITVRDREATIARLLSLRQAVNLEFNNGYFSGATYHGLGYNILNSNVANIRYNHCISTNSRKGMDGRHGKNITITGGFFNVINDHYGRNYLIRDVVMSGRSTHIPGYVTPDADFQAWHFRNVLPFGFAGVNFYVENVTVNGASGAIFAGRGDIGDMYGEIKLRDINIKGNDGNVTLINHSIDPSFDFAGEVRTPDKMIIEDVSLENPGRLNLIIGRGFDSGTYGPVFLRNSGPFGDVFSAGSSLTFSSCRIEDGKFEAEPGTLVNFRNCIFFGSSHGLSEENIGTANDNIINKGAEVSFPIEYLNKDIYDN